MAQAESQLAAQIIALPPSCPPPFSDPFFLILPCYLIPFVSPGFASHAWQRMNMPPKGARSKTNMAGIQGLGFAY
eukprot:6489812-Pyramimonas_sp.AAC.1